MKVAIYETLADPAKEIRKKVFIDEQGFQDEYDEIDETAVHFVLFEDGWLQDERSTTGRSAVKRSTTERSAIKRSTIERSAIATCRVFWNEEMNAFALGRLAVIAESRGKNIGSILVNEVEKYVRLRGGTEIVLHAQCRATGFYGKLGFVEFGEVQDEEGCPHIWMRKML